jgi:cytochrome P450
MSSPFGARNICSTIRFWSAILPASSASCSTTSPITRRPRSRERSAARPRFAYLPFGGGPRICIGAQLALTEVSLLVATMAQRYRLKFVPQQDILLLHRVTLHPRDGIRMLLARRN